MAPGPQGSAEDALELERIASGPYCVYDPFRFPPSPQAQRASHSPSAPPEDNSTMEDPTMVGNYAFSNMRGPWLTTAGENMTLAAPAEDMSSWNEWMQYDPAAAASQHTQTVQAKPMSEKGPTGFLKPAREHSPSANRAQPQPQPQHQHPLSQSLPPTSTPVSAPMYSQPNGIPFTFGQNIDAPPAFDFAGHTLSSPADVDVQQQNAFYSSPMWQQQQQQQRQQISDGFFSPPGYDHSTFAAPPASTPSLHHSPSSLNNGGQGSSSSSHSSPEPAVNIKKRKSVEEDDEEDDLEPAPSGKRGKGQPPKKTAHNMIEKRYRTNLNDKIAALRDSVPSLRVMSRPGGKEEDDDPEDLEGLTPAHKLNKATVLSKATEYIRHLEKRNKRLQDEVNTLKTRVESYEKMAISGPMALHNPAGTPDGRYHEDPFMASHGLSMGGPPQGMIPVPDNIAALQRGLPPQQHYASAYPSYAGGARQAHSGPPMVNGRSTSAMMGKLMVGSLAGLMVLEGLLEREQSQEDPAGRGLFALPINLASVLAPRVSLGASTAQLPLAKLLLVMGAFFYLVGPLLSFSSKRKKKSTPVLLSPAPSLASPVEVRRKAWLTAIQTVWVPQHNFILEVAALGLKTLKLSTRKVIGWPGYAYLTGTTKEQEAARLKAWEIALDAQLTGGDAEISKSRLVLTLMASGTLPDTPARLMLKALHIRVLLWEIANAGHGVWWMVDELSAKLARSYWNMARSEHRIAANLASKQGSDAQPLPDHLASLIERECDEVLVPAIIQRAYNLAWNRPSAEKTIIDPSMDGVVEDFAICSPLDALAAWYSSFVLAKALATTLATKSLSPKEGVVTDLNLALQSAPPNSQAQLRALVAQAVVLDEDRNTRIVAALDALPSSGATSLMNPVDNVPVAADVRTALTLARCLSLTAFPSSSARRRATDKINQITLSEVTTTLLSFVAAHKVLTLFMQDAELQAATSFKLEHFAKSLRMWVGHETGKRSGLSNKVRGRIVASCLEASTKLVGLKDKDDVADVDDGYVSASVNDD